MKVRVLSAALLALVAGGCRLGDLVSTPHSAPAAPASLAQAQPYVATTIPTGQYTGLAAVLLSARVSDPDAADQIALQVEVQAVGVPFADTTTAASTAVSTDSVASVVVSGLADNLAYHWQARAMDQTGRASSWVSYGGNAETDADFGVNAVADPPVQPATLTQWKSNGTTAIPLGGATDDSTVIVQATVTDPDPGDSVHLEVERQPVGTQFTNTPTATGAPVAAGGTSRVTLVGNLDNVGYRWQARAVDRSGLLSGWVSLGGNPNQPHYQINIPQPPNAPTSLGQFRSNAQTAIAPGDSTDQTTVVFKATLTDPDPGDQVRLDVEVQPVGVAFAGTPTASGALVSDGKGRVDVTGLATGTNYHWQVRAVDQTGRTSSWVPFGSGGTDFRVR